MTSSPDQQPQSTHRDFTTGPIAKQIVRMALPIMGTAFLQMAYNLTDIYWIGQEGSAPMTALGAAGFFVWFATAIAQMPKLAAEVSIAHALGQKRLSRAARMARHAIVLSIATGLILALIYRLAHPQLLALIGIQDPLILQMACSYSAIVAYGFPALFLINSLYGVYNGYGLPKKAFLANAAGLILNVILDPILIRGYLGLPRMGVQGAALATVIAQTCVVAIFLIMHANPQNRFHRLLKGFRLNPRFMARIVRIGAPTALQSALFSMIGLAIAGIVVQWGDTELAVQTLGSQIEAVTWMTAAGFATALTAFAGQNYGAKNYTRMRAGFRNTLAYMTAHALLTSILFYTLGGEIFALFVDDEKVIHSGATYMRIMALSQIFMVLESTAGALHNAIGKTYIPATVSILFNLLRIPLALWWGTYSAAGVWYAITVSSILKGSVSYIWLYSMFLKKSSMKKKR